MNETPATSTNQELLFWSVLVVIELLVIAVLVPSGFLSFLAALAIIPIVYWPLKDSLNWPAPRPKDPEQPAGASGPVIH